jgi:hypothetical protein
MRLRGRSLRRKLAFAGLGLVALLVIAVAALWFLKPWVPEIELTEPGASGRRVVESGLYANYFPAGSAGARACCCSVGRKAASALR